jgi:hypothetical protein
MLCCSLAQPIGMKEKREDNSCSCEITPWKKSGESCIFIQNQKILQFDTLLCSSVAQPIEMKEKRRQILQ